MGTKRDGEIVEVQGGYIVRSTGLKDRHSKVYTSKGPRDRRVRLAAHTAIQFYDVQDRLGYDRPSKAVDWLINKAKSAIDKLDESQPWHPNVGSIAHEDNNNNTNESAAAATGDMEIGNDFRLDNVPSNNNFIEQHTMKSFLPTNPNASLINFQNYPSDVMARNMNPREDLGLSLHSFQEPGLIHGQTQVDTRPIFGSGSVSLGFEADFHRMVAWSNTENRGGGSGGGFEFNSLSLPPQRQTLLGESSRRGPLQSSFSEAVHVWNDLPIAAPEQHKTQDIIHNSSIFGSRFASDGLLGFCIPAQIQGEDGHSVVSDRPSSSSANSHH
ncbi:hypothetical protein ACFE04_017659 [Oxalis oulophora]